MEDSRGATATAPSAESGPRTDRLELLQSFTGGSVGTVHKARSPKLNRTLVLRQVQVPEWLDDVDDLIKRILAEARAASALDHPNIGRLYTGGYKGFTVFLTVEFVDGIGVREYVASHNLGVTEIVALGKQLCAALDYAHQKNVVHNALDPANIKVLADGRLKLLDFGLLRDKHLYSPTPAKRLENEHYLSPEQLKNKPITPVANVFSAATILYELLTTRNPFAGKHLGEVDRNIIEIDPPPASQAHARASEAISKVLMRALAKHPLARYQSCGEFATALAEAEALKGAQAKVALTASTSVNIPAAAAAPVKPTAGDSGTAWKPVPVAAPNGSPQAVAASPPSNGAPQPVSAPPKPKIAVRPDNLPPPPPSRMPVKTARQLWMLGGIFAAIFVVSALAISLSHRSKISPPPPEPIAEAPQKSAPEPAPETLAPATAPAAAAEPEATTDTPESPAPNGKQHRVREAKPVSAAVAEGTLAISSDPEGATFSIEGRTTDAWKTPQVVGSLAPAVYKVTVSKPGYSTETRNIQVVSGNRVSLDVKLAALKATLAIGGTPVGAGIVIDGKPTGKFSPAQFTLDPAVHTITLHREGFFDNTGQIKLVAGQTVSYSPSMMPEGRTDNIKVVGGFKKLFGKGSSAGMAHLEIKSDPKGAQITINGSSLSRTTPVEIQLDPGNYEVVLQKDGYKPTRKVLILQPDDKVKIDERLSM